MRSQVAMLDAFSNLTSWPDSLNIAGTILFETRNGEQIFTLRQDVLHE